MARVTVERAVEKIGNRFDLVLLAARRARQLQIEGKQSLVKRKGAGCTVLALLEIEENRLDKEKLQQLEKLDQDAQEMADLVNSPLRWQTLPGYHRSRSPESDMFS